MAAVPEPESEKSTTESILTLLPLILAAVTSMVGVIKLGVERWLGRGSRSKKPIPAHVPNVLGVKTRDMYPSKAELSRKRSLDLLYAIYLAFLATMLLGYGIAFWVLSATGVWDVDGSLAYFGGLLMICLAFVPGGVAATFLQNRRKLEHKSSRDPIESQQVSLFIEDSYEVVVKQAVRALIFAGAVKSAGTRVAMAPPRGGFLEGGMHGWPERRDGERIRITLHQENSSGYRVSVVSASFWPRLRSTRHDENVGEVLGFFLAHD